MAFGQERDWLRPEIVSEPGHQEKASGPAMFELRPLSVGEILDRIFALYRSRFWLFASISVVSGCAHVVVQAVSLAGAHTILQRAMITGPAGKPQPLPMNAFLATEMRSWIAALVFFLVSAVTQAATSLAMSETYLNRPTSAKTALLAAARRWYRWIGIALWQAWSMLWVLLAVLIPGLVLLRFGTRGGNTALSVIGGVLVFVAIFAGLPVGVILYLRNALAVPAAMVERLTIRESMRRSKALAAGSKGRIFVVLLIAGILYWVVGMLESPAALMIMIAPRQEHYIAQGITLVISFIGHTVVAPVALIGLTLLYFDQRVRKEALDIQLLLEHSRAGGEPAAVEAPAVTPLAPERIAPVE